MEKHHNSRFFNFAFAHVRNIEIYFSGRRGHGCTLTKHPRKVEKPGCGKAQPLLLLPIRTAQVLTYASRHPWSRSNNSVTTTVGGGLMTRNNLELWLTLTRQFFLTISTAAHILSPFPSKSTNNYGGALPFWVWHDLTTPISLGVVGHGDTLTKYQERTKAHDAVKHSHYYYYQYGRRPSSPMTHVIHDRHPIILPSLPQSAGGSRQGRTSTSDSLFPANSFYQ